MLVALRLSGPRGAAFGPEFLKPRIAADRAGAGQTLIGGGESEGRGGGDGRGTGWRRSRGRRGRSADVESEETESEERAGTHGGKRETEAEKEEAQGRKRGERFPKREGRAERVGSVGKEELIDGEEKLFEREE